MMQELLVDSSPRDHCSLTTSLMILSTFPSLRPFFTSPSESAFVGLLFAASWCPDCTNTRNGVPAVAKYLARPSALDVIYVSSDQTAEQCQQFYNNYCQGFAGCLPFESASDRAELKRQWGVCAARERVELGLSPEQRLGGIPSLLIFDKESGKLLTRDGMNDVVECKDPMAKWKTLLQEL